jgi:hypothetical protein
MTRRASDPTLRSHRKQDLLLASKMARGLALGAFDELAGQADALAYRAVRFREWLSSPVGLVAGSAAAAVVLAVSLRHARSARAWRWGRLAWRVWRLWRSAAAVLLPRERMSAG